MKKIINDKNFSSFAYSNEKLLNGEPEAIVLEFFGLGGNSMLDDNWGWAKEYAKRNIIFAVPYYNPWSWMNDVAVNLTDEVVDCILNRQKNSLKVISTGGSMGGLSSLVYANYAKHTPSAVVSNCPVCDLLFHYTERPDLPRTIYSAFGHYNCDLKDAIKTASPIHLIGQLPKIPYRIFHCSADKLVNINSHSKVFVDKLQNNGYDAELFVVKDKDHCDLGEEGTKKYFDTIVSYALNK